MKELPKKYQAHESEKKWVEYWQENRTYKFNPDTKKEVYSIDTPPPTVSGRMHIGHAFSFSQMDFIARYKRMRGYELFYPFGTDDNGLPFDKLVEKTNKIRSKDFERKEYVKLCLSTLKKLLPEFIQDWRQLGISCDFDVYYSTINDYSQRISQKSFIDLYKAGREYRKEAPTLWCPECHVAIAQAELEDKEHDSTFNDIAFTFPDGKELIIATTRPELLPACVSIFYHPDDKRYQKYKGKKAKVPLFGHEVIIMPDERVSIDKGTGIVMCCTFGDQTDMEWYFQYNLPLREAIDGHGHMTKLAKEYEGMKIKQARKAILDDLEKEGLLKKKEHILHVVNVHERCGHEIEILHSKQWFIKYLDKKKELLKAGNQLNWYPKFMKNRFDNWVKGIKWDWCISRQRHFGIPIPVWYCEKCDEVILPNEKDLPVDPTSDKPPISTCPKCSHTKIVGEKDVLDTWATSSLTPRLAADLFVDHPVYKKLQPTMNLRPQAHDIITFWLFNTVVKSQFHNKVNPWKDAMISGWALDPHGKKMSKSKGNVVDPIEVHKKFNSDAIRFWAAGTKLGDDMPYQEKDLVTANKTITKLWNATKFAIMQLGDYDLCKPKKLEVIDAWLLSKLSRVVKLSTTSFDKYEYSYGKAETEKFFWSVLCDNYLEIIKDRMYNPEVWGEDKVGSGKMTLYTAFLTVLKLFAPIMPFVTEEVYHLYFATREGEKSVHNSAWPTLSMIDEKAELAGDLLVEVSSIVRKYKSENAMSLKEELSELVIETKNEKELGLVLDDLRSVTKTKNVIFGKAPKGFVSQKLGLKVSIKK
ncbi:valine--tRNA ligase [Candidatus Woesearchaeota archaeon]|nr:valine--tRNA ligase [Candidatus Woesearchaeota archaeon]